MGNSHRVQKRDREENEGKGEATGYQMLALFSLHHSALHASILDGMRMHGGEEKADADPKAVSESVCVCRIAFLPPLCPVAR